MNFIFVGEDEYICVYNELLKPLDTHILSILGQFGPLTDYAIKNKLLEIQPNEKFFAYPDLKTKISDMGITRSIERLAKLNFVVKINKQSKINMRMAHQKTQMLNQ